MVINFRGVAEDLNLGLGGDLKSRPSDYKSST